MDDLTSAMLDALVIDHELSYNVADLSSKFNKKKFFNKEFYPISLFYLGMTTLRACLNFPEIMLDRLYRPVFIRHIVSVMLLLTTTENILESNSQNCVGQNSEQALNTPLLIH